MHQNNDYELKLTALTAEEREIIRALRDPEKANILYALMQSANNAQCTVRAI